MTKRSRLCIDFTSEDAMRDFVTKLKDVERGVTIGEAPGVSVDSTEFDPALDTIEEVEAREMDALDKTKRGVEWYLLSSDGDRPLKRAKKTWQRGRKPGRGRKAVRT